MTDLPTALAEAGVPSGPLRSTLSVERFRDDVAHDLDAIGRFWFARRLEGMKGNGFVKDAILFGGHYYTVQELLDLLAPEAP